MANPKLEVLTPQNSQVIFIDHQPQMAFAVQSVDRQTLKNTIGAKLGQSTRFEQSYFQAGEHNASEC